MSCKLVLSAAFGALCFSLISGQCFYETKYPTSSSHCDTSKWDTKLLQEKCAPIFGKKDTCCPFSFYCPSDNKILSLIKGNSNSKIKCQFGEWDLNEGDHFTTEYQYKDDEGRVSPNKVTCKCERAPYLKCVEA